MPVDTSSAVWLIIGIGGAVLIGVLLAYGLIAMFLRRRLLCCFGVALKRKAKLHPQRAQRGDQAVHVGVRVLRRGG